MYKIIIVMVPFLLGGIAIVKGFIDKDVYLLTLGFGLWCIMNSYEIMFIKEELRNKDVPDAKNISTAQVNTR